MEFANVDPSLVTDNEICRKLQFTIFYHLELSKVSSATEGGGEFRNYNELSYQKFLKYFSSTCLCDESSEDQLPLMATLNGGPGSKQKKTLYLFKPQ